MLPDFTKQAVPVIKEKAPATSAKGLPNPIVFYALKTNWKSGVVRRHQGV